MQVNPADTNPHLDLEKMGMIFEEVFKNKCHARIADMSAGVCKLR
jgi:hypothetical protein